LSDHPERILDGEDKIVLKITDARELYEGHVKRLPPAERLRLVELIAHEMATRSEEPGNERSLLELEGLGAEIWQGVDAQEYVCQ
jgi:hypothetical protein